jgi:hypothetical protein
MRFDSSATLVRARALTTVLIPDSFAPKGPDQKPQGTTRARRAGARSGPCGLPAGGPRTRLRPARAGPGRGRATATRGHRHLPAADVRYDHPSTINATNELGASLRATGRVEAARQTHEVNVAPARRVLGEDHHFAVEGKLELARDLHALGDVEAARRLSEDTLIRAGHALMGSFPERVRMGARDRALSRKLPRAALSKVDRDTRKGSRGNLRLPWRESGAPRPLPGRSGKGRGS